MVQICDKAICKPLHLIFSSCIESGIFPTEWKKANVVPIHKRDDKQNVKNYRPVSLLQIFGKIFERLIYNEMYSCFRLINSPYEVNISEMNITTI